jgi:AcrR family transcriptional regulator
MFIYYRRMRHKDSGKREAICNAAVKLINANGLAETSMAKIAKEASVSPATIYVYFENKEDLLNKLYLLVKRRMSNTVIKGLDETLSVEATFRLLWHNHYRYLVEHADQFIFAEQFSHSPLIERVSKDEGHEYLQAIFALFERGKKEKIIKEIPAEILMAYAFFPSIQLAKSQLNGDLTVDEETLRIAADVAWDSIAL